VGAVSLLALVARYLYRRVRLLRTLSIQPPLIAGLALFVLGPEMMNTLPGGIGDTLKGWPSIIVSFLFAALIFSEPIDPGGGGGGVPFSNITQQAIYVWFLALGQLAIGFLVAESLLVPLGYSPLLAHIIEIGWMGGHGSASAMLAVMEHLGDRSTGELGIFSATYGLVWGGMSGIYLTHHFAKKYGSEFEDPEPEPTRPESPPIHKHLDEPEAITTSAFLIAFTVGISYLIRDGVIAALRRGIPNHPIVAEVAEVMESLPVFFIAILIAVLIRKILSKRWFQSDAFGFLSRSEVARSATGLTDLSLELLIISAVGTIHLAAFLDNLLPFLLLMLAGTIWTGFALLFFARRMLPERYWKELGILNYGMATGITAVGLMLLGNLPGGAKKRGILIYGLAAPYSAPFIGGGIISLILPALTAYGYGKGLLIAIVPLMIALYLIGKRLNYQRT
jgi:ESS family glutamate:Na+ symporter